jgi:hypothetical protein
MEKKNYNKQFLLISSIFLAFLFSIHLNRAYAANCTQTLRSFGAIGDGRSEDSNAIRNAFRGSCNLDGENLSYAINGSFEIMNNIVLSNARFYQTGTGSSLRTLMRIGGPVTLRKVFVHRGTNQRNGSSGESAGIFLSNASDSLLEDVEVTGNGYGSGIWLDRSHRVILQRPFVHDMLWSTATFPRYEQMTGIWLTFTDSTQILYGKIKNLLGETGDNVYRSTQSDGITASGTSHLFILSTAIENTGEGVDLTGSDGNQYFEIAHSATVDSDSWGFKFANSAAHGVIRDSVAVRPGISGFVVQGPSEANLPVKTNDITISRCRAENAGYNGRWAFQTVSGFFILQGSFDLDYPKNIRILDSEAIDTQSAHTMKYGFFSQSPAVGGYNLTSTGHIFEGGYGIVGVEYGFNSIRQQVGSIMGCSVTPDYQNFYFDQGYLAGWTLSRFIADLQDSKRRGIYSMCQ